MLESADALARVLYSRCQLPLPTTIPYAQLRKFTASTYTNTRKSDAYGLRLHLQLHGRHKHTVYTSIRSSVCICITVHLFLDVRILVHMSISVAVYLCITIYIYAYLCEDPLLMYACADCPCF